MHMEPITIPAERRPERVLYPELAVVFSILLLAYLNAAAWLF